MSTHSLLPLRICFVSVVLIISGVALFAQTEIRYAAEMTRLPAGSDIAAMGDAGVVLPRRAVSALWNPGAVPFIQKFEISAEIADLYHGMSQQACFAGHVPLQHDVGATILYTPFFSGDIPSYDSLEGTYQERIVDENLRPDGIPKGYFRNNQHLVIIALGKNFPLKLPRAPGGGLPLPLDIAVGINIKGYWQTMNPENRTHLGIGINADVGFLGRVGLDYNLKEKETSRQILLGIAVRDLLPSDIVWMQSPQEYRERIKYSQQYGMAYVDKSGDLRCNLTIALSLEKQYELSYHGGVEAEFWDMVIFRAGFSGKTPTAGAGIRYKQYFMDYAFRFDEIDFSYMRLALGVTF